MQRRKTRRRLRPWARKALETIVIAVVIFGFIAIMLGAFFGAAVQESIKLHPLSEEELAEIGRPE